MATAFITHADCAKHDMGSYHPECPARLSAIEDQFIASGLAPHLERFDAPEATDEQLARAHPQGYIDQIREAAPASGMVHLDPDTAMNPYTLSAALHAAGAAVLATDLVIGRRMDTAFCSVRPPGHHACRSRAMGFCLFNNVAIGALHALEQHGLERVAIVDFDVHHGNGTEDIFSDDERVLMVGSFQHPFYPYSGTDHVAPNIKNVPLAAGTRGDGLQRAFEEVWRPALEDFAPEMIFISAGFDAHVEDDMAMLGFVDRDYAWITERLMTIADKYSQGRVVSVLEGGYNLSALGRSAAQHVRVLAGLHAAA